MRKVVHFFQEPFRYKPVEKDVCLVAGIVDELKTIQVTPCNNFLGAQQKFLASLIECLMNAYADYCHESSGAIYTGYRKSRSTWKHGALENGVKLAEERTWLIYWRKEGIVATKNHLQQEIEMQLLAPLEKALREGGGIAKNSRVDFLLRSLKACVKEESVYQTVAKAEEAMMDGLFLACDQL